MPGRTSLVLAFAIFASLLTLGPVPEAASQQANPNEQVWSGYLYRAGDELRIGWGVLAMGVMAQAAHVVEGPLGEKLAKLASTVRGDYFFWNYSWLAGEGGALRKTKTSQVPRVLVKLRGTVETEGKPDRNRLFSGGKRRLKEGRLVEIEFLSEKWLLAWRALTSDRFNPYWLSPESKIESDRDKVGPLVTHVVAALGEMRKLSKITPALAERAKAIDPKAKAVNAYQRQMENMALRWVHRMVAKHQLEVPGLDALGQLPPTRTDVQNWFLEAKDKTALIARIRKTFRGDLRDVGLAHYRKNERGGISWVVTPMHEVSGWTDALFVTRQKLTRETLRR